MTWEWQPKDSFDFRYAIDDEAEHRVVEKVESRNGIPFITCTNGMHADGPWYEEHGTNFKHHTTVTLELSEEFAERLMFVISGHYRKESTTLAELYTLLQQNLPCPYFVQITSNVKLQCKLFRHDVAVPHETVALYRLVKWTTE